MENSVSGLDDRWRSRLARSQLIAETGLIAWCSMIGHSGGVKPLQLCCSPRRRVALRDMSSILAPRGAGVLRKARIVDHIMCFRCMRVRITGAYS